MSNASNLILADNHSFRSESILDIEETFQFGPEKIRYMEQTIIEGDIPPAASRS
jgi:hypothetical protein